MAIEERDEQVAAFKEASATLEKEVRDDWRDMVDNWHTEEDMPTDRRTAPNPYLSKWEKSASVKTPPRNQPN